MVVRFGTVHTCLTWSDFLKGAIGFAVGAALGWMFNKGIAAAVGKWAAKKAAKAGAKVGAGFAEYAATEYAEGLGKKLTGDVIKNTVEDVLEDKIGEAGSQIVFKAAATGLKFMPEPYGEWANRILEPFDQTGTLMGDVGDFVVGD
jgi:hypothetical protein